MKNLHKEYLLHSQDFLKLLGEKSRRADSSKTIAYELGIMEFYHDGIDLIFKEYENRVHSLTLQVVNEGLKFKLLEKEFSQHFKKEYGVQVEPTTTQWNQIKKKFKHGVNLSEICKHFDLSKSQIIELVDK